uniref:Phosphoesterase RecJ-like protein n=1 Tax=Thermogemmatispora argillosa TaxID=2045280 RepID=A0A455T0J8_9CHLR|nr:phosphoesterase RecJ-like protein [Thermogemmatispora argillosa]
MSASATALAAQLPADQVEQALALLRSARRVALLAHEHPDGDCLGSALGLAHMLWTWGKVAVPCCADPLPRAYTFLPAQERFQQDLGGEDFDLVVALDAGELPRFGSLYERHRSFLERVPLLNIDHHISSAGCGQVRIIDPTAAATAELLVLFQQQAQLPLSPEAALCLLTGLMTDTGSFQFPSTTARTLAAAALLVEVGASPEPIAQAVFRTHPLAQERLRARVMLQAQTACNGQLIWSWASDATLAETGALPEMDDNLAGLLRDIEGVKIAAFFKNYGTPGTTRLSLRCAAPYNAAEICQRLGRGGGHARAAGATLDLPLEQAIPFVVARLEEELRRGEEQWMASSTSTNP